MRAGAVALLVAGCNQAFSLNATDLRLDAQVIDEDHDGVDDVRDNCLGVANPTQSDVDHDTLGDACDNCPLLANFAQEHGGDADALGDACDPHPATDGDCLILVDAFADPALFDTRWMTQPAGTPAITPKAGSVEFAESAAAMFTSRELANDVFDVQVAASLAPLATSAGTGQVMAVSNATTFLTGYGCAAGGVGSQEQAQAFEGTSNSTATQGISLSSPAVGSKLLLRLTTRTPAGDPIVSCRLDHGIAFGFWQFVPANALANGSPGVFADIAVTVFAIMVSRFQPGVTCPEPVIR